MLKVLKDGRFARLWTGQTISYLGDWLSGVAVMSLLAFRWHASPLTLSVWGLTAALPMLVLGPVAGVFADRWNRKATMIAFDLVRAAAVLGYAAAGNTAQVYGVALVMSVAGVFFNPSRGAVIREIVPVEDLMAANTLSSLSLQLTKIVGPAVGGLIVATLGETVCFWADSASFVVSALFIATVPLPDHRKAGEGPTAAGPSASAAGSASAGESAAAAAGRSFLADLKAGLGHIRRTKAVLYSLVLVALAVFSVGMFDAVAGIFIRENFGTDPRTLGLVVGVVGLGTALSALWMGNRGSRYSRPGLTAVGVLWMGLSLALLVAVSVYGGPLAVPGAAFFAAALGAGVTFVSIPSLTTLQVETPPALMGRVGGAFDSVLSGASVLAYPAGGVLGDVFGATGLTALSSVPLIVVGVLALLGMPGARPLGSRVKVGGEDVPAERDCRPR